MVRQSCLGTFRRVAVTFGEAQRGSHGMARRGELSSVGAGHGKAVELWLVWERFVAVRQVMDWRGSRGDAGLCTARCSLAKRGRAVKALRGMSRLSEERLGKVRQSRRCKFWHGEFWRVLSGLVSLGEVKRVLSG